MCRCLTRSSDNVCYSILEWLQRPQQILCDASQQLIAVVELEWYKRMELHFADIFN